jgi:hypothetical protein
MRQSNSKKARQGKNNRRGTGGANLALYLALGGMVLVAAALLAAWKGSQPGRGSAPAEVKGQARLKVDREKLDFGEVKLGQTVTAAFTLTNVGDQALRITEKPKVEVVEGC